MSEKTLTPKQQFVLDQLLAKKNEYVSPTAIGMAWERYTTGVMPNYSQSRHSAWASPICKSLVDLGLATRNKTGQYQAVAKVDPEQERLAYNAKNGFLRVAVLSTGLEIYKKQQEDGSWIYYGQSGVVFAPLWHTNRASKEEFLAIAKDLFNLELRPGTSANLPAPPKFKFSEGQRVYYLKDQLVHSGIVQSRRQYGHGLITYTTVHGEYAESKIFESRQALVDSL